MRNQKGETKAEPLQNPAKLDKTKATSKTASGEIP
jgi:hypothetical protein